MAKDSDEREEGRRRRWPFVAAGVAVVVIGVAAFALLSGGKKKPSPPTPYSGPGGAYTVMYPPDTWQPGEEGRLARRDGTALVSIREQGSVPEDLDDFTRATEAELEERYPDLRRGSANLVTVTAGQAYSYSFTRTRARKAQTVVLVPAGESGYRLDAVVDEGAAPASREMAQIIRSFALGPQ